MSPSPRPRSRGSRSCGWPRSRSGIDANLALGRDAVLSHRLQLFLLQREAGDLAEIEELIERAVADFPTRPVFRCALSCVHAGLGHRDRAQDLLHQLAPDDFAAIQRDNEFLFSLGFLADTAHELHDVHAATVLYDLLAPFGHLNAANAGRARDRFRLEATRGTRGDARALG